ncbi:uncharacterized protein LOC143295414 [Babylonia areolata]|uniref:uncharacterized protein LOC143295414 n=1 Tax=Babylonia areolata TaxID=304850 RepID=UPI003FD4B92F
MAVPVRLRNVPEYLRSAQFSDYYESSQGAEPQELLQFPKSTCVLWDGTSTGSPVFLHITQNCKPQLLLWEKLLWLIHKQVDSDGAASKVLVGSLSVDKDADGVSFKIDRLDTRTTDVNASLLQDDVLIPVQISSNNDQERQGGSKEDYVEAVKMLQKRCSSHEALELTSLLLVKGWCSVRYHSHADKAIAHLQFDVVTPGNVFKATPVNPVPIVPSALAKNLAGPRSLSHMQGRPKMGYLSMDATRKLLLVLESDPKVANLPIVGIWVSGVSMVHHPFVWGSCLRYLQNERMQDRVCTPPEGFMLLLYSSLHSKPEFYEVCATSGKSDLQFNLYTGYEVTTLHKQSSGPEPGVIEWELQAVKNGPKREMFDAALESVKSQKREASSSAARPSISTTEDIMPRMTPAPHQSKAMTIRPMVPELSMIWNDNNVPSPQLQPFPSSPKPPACLNTAFSTPCSTPMLSISAPVSSGRKTVGFVPSSQHSCPASVALAGSGATHYCESNAGQQLDSECLPRASFPARYPQPRTVCDQNNSARTGGPAAVSSLASPGFLGTVYSNCIPQSSSSAAAVPHQYSSAQAGGAYNNMGVAMHSSQGYACTTAEQCAPPQQHMYVPQPQPQHLPRPRLTAPAGMHFCRPDTPSPAVRPAHSFPHPSVPVQRPPHSSPSPQSTFRQGGPFHGDVPVPSSHPHTQHPGHPPAHTHFHTMTQGAAVLQPPVSHTNNTPGYQNSAQGSLALPQGTEPHSQGTVTPSQGQSRPPPSRHTEGPGMYDWQQDNRSAKAFLAQNWPDSQSSVNPYAQLPPGKPQGTQPLPCHPGQLQSDGYVSAAPLGAQSPAPSTQNDSHQSHNTSSSAKSSDDSGLSITPDHSNPSPKLSHSAGPQSKAGADGTQALSLESVNWSGVPGEVVQLLVQQDAQLKLLQAQIQQLLSQQQQQPASAPSPSPGSNFSTPTPVPSSVGSTPATLKKETCSTAVNTTLLEPASSPWGRPPGGQGTQCASIQTSPQKPFSPHHAFPTNTHRHSPSSSHSQDALPPFQQMLPQSLSGVVERPGSAHTPCRQEGLTVGETPSELRHQGPVQLSSTEHEERSDMGGSLHSTGSLEHPSPVRSMEPHLQNLSNSTPSPMSASMCVRPDESEENGAHEISPDSKEYYDQLINNIRLFLNSHSQNADNTDNTEGNKTNTDTTADNSDDATPAAGLKLFDSTMGASLSPQSACPNGDGVSSSNTTLIPHINAISLMLGSDTDSSLEINAMAMKYLRDEQLTQVARHHQMPGRGGSNHLLLRQALAASLDTTGTSDISRLGMSASNMSMATKKYLEKHGLLGGGSGESLLDSNHTIRLQTDFSLAIMSEVHSDPSMPASPQKSAFPQHANTQSPVKREVLKPPFKPSPAIAEERGNVHSENERKRLRDLGASPVLRPAHRYHRDLSPEDTPIFPERYHGPQQQDLISDCSLATEDDRILDIEKLKQMPKLL